MALSHDRASVEDILMLCCRCQAGRCTLVWHSQLRYHKSSLRVPVDRMLRSITCRCNMSAGCCAGASYLFGRGGDCAEWDRRSGPCSQHKWQGRRWGGACTCTRICRQRRQGGAILRRMHACDTVHKKVAARFQQQLNSFMPCRVETSRSYMWHPLSTGQVTWYIPSRIFYVSRSSCANAPS